MTNKIKYIFLVIGGISLLYMVYSFGIENIFINLKKIGWYFIPIVATWAFVYIFNTIAWRFIINEPTIPFRNILSVTISGYALNYITPFFHLGGEPYRIIVLKDLLGTTKAVAVTISYVMLHFLSSFLIWIVAVVIVLALLPLSALSHCFFAVSLIVFGYVVYLFIKGYKNGVTKSFLSFLISLPMLNKFGERVAKKEDVLDEIDKNTIELYTQRKKGFFAANLFEFLSRVIATIEYFFILKALGFNPTLLETFIINAGLGLIANMFFIVPFELGVKEGGLYAMFSFLNYTPSIGIFVGIVNRLREFFWILIGLLLMTLNGNKSKKEKMAAIFYEESDNI